MRATSLPILFCLPAGASGAEFVKTTEDKCQRQADGVLSYDHQLAEQPGGDK